ncbi:MAG: 16S rRNA (cytosine(1402)-N(4))-methyltransferase RsmH [Gammaproteobacteria bacterium]|nr:16S rRNA (cytosine(1402)-N(4))-methyltransferase RsmH [Gammaproteobacteria bacterium]MYD02981.1 16S rRNA (cytosine(1402)-N(4))-methyltransferase RsmH [Gammaproteobacteria bacterium]MYI25604.1 16S rRNA (cytosine(1402)-N(4))-methyltransferase RsmH [Gammaproteobacteria bacterium]
MNAHGAFEHEPALLEETLHGLALDPHGLYVDATYGRGGHSRAILAGLGKRGRLHAMDCDPQAAQSARALAERDPRFSIEHGNFRHLARSLERKGWQGSVHGVLFDLGVSLPQLTDPDRGFSLRSDGPLDMRMNPTEGQSAAEWLNRAPMNEIARVIRNCGEEPQALRIADAICRNRPVSSCSGLARLVASAARNPKPGIHPATRTFMALRIFINAELKALEDALPQAVRSLRPHGRLCVIAFHSLEDRIVKRYMRNASRLPPPLARLPSVPSAAGPLLKIVGRMQRCGAAESRRNPRARSARLRVAERLAA